MYLRAAVVWLTALSLTRGGEATVCPPGCVCSTTTDGLHKATCSNLQDLYKFTLRQKHHNINILDLSHNNITKLSDQLDRLTEVVTLDLSTNGFSEIDRFLQNSKKLVHLNLANNRIRWLDLSVLPKSVSSLDLSNNLLYDVPDNVKNLKNLEHLEMEGNPMICSCDNILSRDFLASKGILIDHVKCVAPPKFKGLSWLELKTKEACRSTKHTVDMDIMMGDQPTKTAEEIGQDSLMLKSKHLHAFSDLDEGQTWVVYGNTKEDDDEIAFLRAKRQESVNSNIIEGSGNNYGTDEPEHRENLSASQFEDEQILPTNAITTEEPLEGSGEGSGFIRTMFQSESEPNENIEYGTEEPTTEYKELYTNHVDQFLGRANAQEDSEIPDDILPKRPSVYMGSDDWFNSTTSTTSTTTVGAIQERIQIQKIGAEQTAEAKIEDEKPAVHRTGTYVCIVIIVVLLVGLIGFAIVKGQMRKRRDRRLQRQQKRDVEKASKEMVDMNTSLLGKPAPTNNYGEKKANGKYELVPTHETPIKKTENGNVTENKNKSSPRDNNQNREERPRSLATVEASAPPTAPATTATTSPDSKKETDSLSSEDIFMPLNEYGNGGTDAARPLTNGDHNTDSDYLSPSHEYTPVYSPDMGRVRIKLTETQKPKTPVLVNRSRSNAGDIIITPTVADGVTKSTT